MISKRYDNTGIKVTNSLGEQFRLPALLSIKIGTVPTLETIYSTRAGLFEEKLCITLIPIASYRHMTNKTEN
ncbi:hypothetical protein T11_15724 [Trichinella zimbabwensis]|uniref:Uncharacterized protein n=1 Tax=Trichinella zimbabwensis TaxID=268475 RepID=A0A0V1GLX9_9BILA|nr:hypothetical protein T11_6516 [Trichinella zimbabwensis]KRY99102.1 hypothetical protein T11_2205 [Trichinella zimbabwensis]KRY99182.1 hypothetical protein T11_15724 [Trichinella zimbabwensis]